MEPRSRRWPILVFFFSLIAAIVFGLGILPHLVWGKAAMPGWIGENHELVNVVFSALAFAGVIYTVLLQSDELRLQRQELEETRTELKRSADAQQKSEQTLLLTAFLSAQNSLFLANEQQIAAEEKDWFRPSSIERTRILVLLKTMTDMLHERIPQDLALTPRKAVRHCLRCYSADLEAFLSLLQAENSFDAMRCTLLEQTARLSRFLDMLPQDDDERLQLKSLIDEVTTIVGDPGMSRDGLGVAKYSDEQRDELKSKAQRSIMAMRMYTTD